MPDNHAAFRRWRDRKEEGTPWLRPEELQHVPWKGKVVLINGAFDLLHAGHMRMIFVAASQGSHLICALDTDEKIRAAKGPGRPYQTFIERAAALAYMPIDIIVPVTTTEEMGLVIEQVDLRVQSDEYLQHPTRYPACPRLFVRNSGLHTTTLAERIRNAH